MKEVLEFIKANWQLIVAALVFILSFILQLFKKKPINNIFQSLFEACLYGLSLAEKEYPVGTHGKYSLEKMETALDHAASYLYLQYPDVDFDYFDKTCRTIIEAVLSTPQKGGSADAEKKTHDEK